MGILNKLLGKPETEKPQTNIYEEEWDFYFSRINDVPASVCVDLGLIKIAPVENRQQVVWISVNMNHAREDGLSSQEESTTLGQIEDALAEAIHSKHPSIFAGRITSGGLRDFYFYLEDITLYDKTISDAMLAFPDYEYNYGTKEDAEWSGYFEMLYPSKEELQTILNRRVTDHLEESGDPLDKEREVYHWIYFKTKDDREKFTLKVKDENFDILNMSRDKTLGEFPFLLQISRVDKVDPNSVDNYVMHLWHLAREMNGQYDGWETSVEKA